MNLRGASASFNDGGFGVGYHRTYYGDAIGPDGVENGQIVGGLTITSHQFSAKIENDFMGDKHDRWRSNAVELGFWGGDIVLGTTLYNNRRNEGDPVHPDSKYDHFKMIGKEKFGRWIDGQTYSSPLYVGFKTGNKITRLGYSHHVFQHAAQNWFAHEAGFARLRLFGYANYFMDYDNFQYGTHSYSGYYNPYSLWGR